MINQRPNNLVDEIVGNTPNVTIAKFLLGGRGKALCVFEGAREHVRENFPDRKMGSCTLMKEGKFLRRRRWELQELMSGTK